MKTEILYEDKAIAVIYKPAGLATQTARTGEPDTVSELKNHLYRANQSAVGSCGLSAPYLGVIHRLDQPVEGLLVFAKNGKAAAALSGQLQKQKEGSFSKRYYAVLCGQPAERTGKLIHKFWRRLRRQGTVSGPAGRYCAMKFWRPVKSWHWRISGLRQDVFTRFVHRWRMRGLRFWETENMGMKSLKRQPGDTIFGVRHFALIVWNLCIPLREKR